MIRLLKIFLFLVVALSLGFFLGVNNTSTSYKVYDSAGNLVKSQSPTSQSIFLPGLNMESVPWYISRASAIAAYLLLFTIVIWGMGMAIGATYKFIDPARAWQIHQDMGLSFGVLVIIHAFSLLFDAFIGFKIFDILIPFYSNFKPIYLSLGIIGFYLLLGIIFSSIFIRLSKPRIWRKTHYLVYPLFIFATIHGFFIGTDSKTILMQGVYIFTSLIFLSLFVYRFLVYPRRFKKLS